MDKKGFLKSKLELLSKDGEKQLDKLATELGKMVENGQDSNMVKVPADGNWFKLEFKALSVKDDRLVINAEREFNGFLGDRYQVTFKGTRAAYLYGYYHATSRFGWSYIEYDIRAYANNPRNANERVFVSTFRADEEQRKLVLAMEQRFPEVRNIYNKYINDNLLRLRLGIQANKEPNQAAYDMHKHIFPSLGYKHCEAIDVGQHKGAWREAKVHWFKNNKDALL